MKEMKRTSVTKGILFCIALLDFMGFTIAATVFPTLFIHPEIHMLPDTWTHATRLIMIGIALGLYPFGQFLGAGVFGSLSDNWGRKKVLLITMIGTVIASLLTALSIDMKLWILLLASRFVLGLFAGNVAVAQASMVDISTEKTKASNISLLQLSLGLAWVFGAPIGSFFSNSSIISWFGFSTPFWILTVALCIVFLMLVFCYQETLQTFREKINIHPLKGFSLVYQALTDKKSNDMFWIWLIFIAGWALFLQFLPTFLLLNFNYTAATVGPLLAFMGGTFAGTQIFISRAVFKRISAEKVLLISMLFPGIATLMIAASTTWWELHIAAFIFPLSMGFTLPGLLTAVSNRGGSHQQGDYLGKAQSIQAIMTVIVTVFGGQLLGMGKYFSTVIGSVLMISAWLIFAFYGFRKAKKQKATL